MTDDAPDYLVEQSGGVLSLTFNRPEHGNAIPAASVTPLTDLFKAAKADPAVRCILIAGKGKHFSTGGDLNAFARDIAEGPAFLAESFSGRLESLAGLVEAVVGFDRPIVAAVRGGVAGAGLLYTLAADIVIGDETAFFLFSHQRVGLSPDGGVSYLLPRVVGLRQATRLIFTAAKVDAEEARQIGLLTSIVSAESLEAEAAKTAARFAKSPQRAIKLAKGLLGASLGSSLRDQLRAEKNGIVECVQDPDFAEGVNSFIEKRPVRFPSTL
jgi:2-(1,2-epoxy-1,2-dihydrophenyl)acetyl-CoA isomerase